MVKGFVFLVHLLPLSRHILYPSLGDNKKAGRPTADGITCDDISAIIPYQRERRKTFLRLRFGFIRNKSIVKQNELLCCVGTVVIKSDKREINQLSTCNNRMIIRQPAVATFLALFAISAATYSVNSFTTTTSACHPRALIPSCANSNIISSSAFMSSVSDDCGCQQEQETVYSGKPSESAMALDAREAIRNKRFLSVDGDSISMDDLIGKTNENKVSIVVFLRSLG